MRNVISSTVWCETTLDDPARPVIDCINSTHYREASTGRYVLISRGSNDAEGVNGGNQADD